MKIIDSQDKKNAIFDACSFLKRGKIISFATETVYGLACDAGNFNAVERIYKLKNRDYSKPIAIFLSNLQQARKILIFSELADKVAKKYLPGPLTIVLPKKDHIDINLATNLNLNDNYLAFRISDDSFVNDLLVEFGGVLAVTSANISGYDSALHHDQVRQSFANYDLDLLIKGGWCRSKIASTVVKFSGEKFDILRQGLIKIEF